MTELKNDRYLRALLRQPVDVTPEWMMRQAVAIYRNIKPRAPRRAILCRCAKMPSWRAK